MAQKIISGGFMLPTPALMPTTTSATIPILLNAADEKAGFIFQIPKAGVIAKVGWLTGTVTTGADIDVRMETIVAANRFPTGTLIAAGANGVQTVLDADDNKWFMTPLGTPPTVTEGQLLAVVLHMENASPGNLNIAIGQSVTFILNMPYVVTALPGFVTKQAQSLMVLEYDDGSYAAIEGHRVDKANAESNFNLNSTPDEKALKFKLPFPVELSGLFGLMELDGLCDFVLYEADDTILETLVWDSHRRLFTQQWAFFRFTQTHSLAKDTVFRLSMKPSTTTNVRTPVLETDTAAIMGAMPGGADFSYSERTNGGAWTDVTTKRPTISLYCTGFSDGAGGGGAAQLVGGGLVS